MVPEVLPGVCNVFFTLDSVVLSFILDRFGDTPSARPGYDSTEELVDPRDNKGRKRKEQKTEDLDVSTFMLLMMSLISSQQAPSISQQCKQTP